MLSIFGSATDNPEIEAFGAYIGLENNQTFQNDLMTAVSLVPVFGPAVSLGWFSANFITNYVMLPMFQSTPGPGPQDADDNWCGVVGCP
jgi:hypothetical protein